VQCSDTQGNGITSIIVEGRAVSELVRACVTRRSLTFWRKGGHVGGTLPFPACLDWIGLVLLGLLFPFLFACASTIRLPLHACVLGALRKS